MLKQYLFLLLLCACSLTAFGQRTTEKEAEEDLDYYNTDDDRSRFDDRGDTFSSNLWFGAGAQLGFSGGNNQSFFQIGLSPIVGYKLNNFLSVGPRGSFAFNSFRFRTNLGDQRENFFTWSAGAFTRARIFGQFFAHAEYSLINERQRSLRTGELESVTRAIPFLGGGISQGGGVGAPGFEVMILFRLSGTDRIGDSPFEFRSGLNYNF